MTNDVFDHNGYDASSCPRQTSVLDHHHAAAEKTPGQAPRGP